MLHTGVGAGEDRPPAIEKVLCIAYTLIQIDLVRQTVSGFAIGPLLMILNAGRIPMLISTVCVVPSVPLNVGSVCRLGLPGALAGSVLLLLIREAWCLHVAAGRLGTLVTALVNFSIVGRSAPVVLVAILIALVVQHYLLLDEGPWIRLAITALAFAALLFAGTFTLGLQKHFLSLVHGLRCNPGANRPLSELE